MQKRWLAIFALGQLLISGVGAQALDSDGDGLPDQWEREGVRVGGVFLDLPAMGADPLHKDIFVQVDYMVAADHTHKPKQESLKHIVASFAAAPVSNPDGRGGISIHIDAGATSPMSGTREWGSLSRAKEVPHADNFGALNAEGDLNFAAVDQLKRANLPPERLGVFRYCLYIHSMTGLGTTSGIARDIPGDDFIVSLGGWSADEGTVLEQTGTFIHELGHTLGLRHGGPDHVGYKPNFFSVMNYLYQTNGLRRNGRDGLMDYSRVAVPALDERNLDENAGIPGAPTGFGTRWFVRRNGEQVGQVVDRGDQPVDWNGDGVFSAGVSHDLNDDGALAVLSTQNDWASIVYAAGSVGQAPVAPAADVVVRELDFVTDQKLGSDYEVSVDSRGSVSGDAGSSVVLRYLVSNLGSRADQYALTAESEHGWPLSVRPSQLNLGPGASQEVTVEVAIPSGSVPGQEDEVELLARSGELVDSGVEDVVVAGLIPPAGGGFSEGSSGCFVATAAYGSYLDPHVVTLRKFRDETLLPVAPGLVRFYYQHSPPLARAVQRNSWFKAGALAVLTPLVLVLEHPLVALVLMLAWLRRSRRKVG